MDKNNRIYIAGHRGLVGSAILRNLSSKGFNNLILKTHQELDLMDQNQVAKFFEKERPEYVFLAAAKVGGIYANSEYPAEFIYNNLMIESNIIHNAYVTNVKKLLFLGSSCIYPKFSHQPIKEEFLLSGYLEPTNDAYAIAKIAGIKMCQAYNKQYGTNYISAMPTNLFGYNDYFDLKNSHVIPALLLKFHTAKNKNEDSVTLWGSGTPKREFLFSDDLAEACFFLMENYDSHEIINVGTGEDLEIKELANIVKKVTNFKGAIEWDSTMPDGTPRKLLDVSKIKSLGWEPAYSLEKALSLTYDWYIQNS